ncbi:MAG: hypothetical protein DRO93_11920 [Candidatus Thorarchaeota archaeon]|nr:MAG: hypothetical protein DRO93_11920 [Candidatus Thorarchaeota archaeon]
MAYARFVESSAWVKFLGRVRQLPPDKDEQVLQRGEIRPFPTRDKLDLHHPPPVGGRWFDCLRQLVPQADEKRGILQRVLHNWSITKKADDCRLPVVIFWSRFLGKEA